MSARCMAAIGVTLAALVSGALGQENVTGALTWRYEILADPFTYPQVDPQDTIRSVMHAVGEGRIDYMLAHLVAPVEVDAKLAGDHQALARLAGAGSQESSAQLIERLHQHLREGTWTIQPDLAWCETEGLPPLSLQRIEGRWFMHNTPRPRHPGQASRQPKP